MTENDDKLITKFMQDRRLEVEDKQFSKRVMKRLPDRAKKIFRIWTAFGFISGTILFFILGGMNLLINMVHGILASKALIQLEQTDHVSLLIVAIILITLGIKRICSIE